MSIQIPAERLCPDTIIHHIGLDFGPFGSFAVVETIEFNGESYAISALFLDEDGEVSRHAVEFIADAGDAIAYGGLGEPKLRPETDVSFDEWAAKAEASGARLDSTLASMPALETVTDAFCAMLVHRNERRAQFFAVVRQAAE